MLIQFVKLLNLLSLARNSVRTVWGLAILVSSMMLLLASVDVRADNEAQSAFALGVEAYDRGNYAKAVDVWENLAQDRGISNGHLFYNLGNAYFRLGKIGEAMACYFGAQELIPRDRDVNRNIEILMKKTAEQLRPENYGGFVDRFADGWGFVSLRERLLLGGVIWIVVSMCCYLVLQGRASRWWAIFAVCIAIPVTVSFYMGWQLSGRWGAVISNAAQIHSGPSESSAILFNLGDGAPVMLHDRVEGWAQVITADGRSGWVRQKEIRVRW
jgi:tetratricopeptide (TPR) repeat protein